MDAEPCGAVPGIFLLVEGGGKSAIGYMTPGESAIREALLRTCRYRSESMGGTVTHDPGRHMT
jgi:hypothetical protein